VGAVWAVSAAARQWMDEEVEECGTWPVQFGLQTRKFEPRADWPLANATLCELMLQRGLQVCQNFKCDVCVQFRGRLLRLSVRLSHARRVVWRSHNAKRKQRGGAAYGVTQQ
jgi:hypothetical protein